MSSIYVILSEILNLFTERQFMEYRLNGSNSGFGQSGDMGEYMGQWLEMRRTGLAFDQNDINQSISGLHFSMKSLKCERKSKRAKE